MINLVLIYEIVVKEIFGNGIIWKTELCGKLFFVFVFLIMGAKPENNGGMYGIFIFYINEKTLKPEGHI